MSFAAESVPFSLFQELEFAAIHSHVYEVLSCAAFADEYGLELMSSEETSFLGQGLFSMLRIALQSALPERMSFWDPRESLGHAPTV